MQRPPDAWLTDWLAGSMSITDVTAVGR